MMTNEEIKKALEKCADWAGCDGCPYIDGKYKTCVEGKLYKDALNLITEQEKENERLEEKCEELLNEKWDAQDDLDCYYDEMPSKIKQAKIDVLNELKSKCHNYYPSIDHYCCSIKAVNLSDIDEMIKELTK